MARVRFTDAELASYEETLTPEQAKWLDEQTAIYLSESSAAAEDANSGADSNDDDGPVRDSDEFLGVRRALIEIALIMKTLDEMNYETPPAPQKEMYLDEILRWLYRQLELAEKEAAKKRQRINGLCHDPDPDHVVASEEDFDEDEELDEDYER